jgi:hypothetical protein
MVAPPFRGRDRDAASTTLPDPKYVIPAKAGIFLVMGDMRLTGISRPSLG